MLHYYQSIKPRMTRNILYVLEIATIFCPAGERIGP